MKPIAITVLVAGLALGCGKHHDHDHNGHHHHKEEGHSHEAPNGGVLVELSHDSCHLEFLLDESNATRMTILAHEFHPITYVKLPMAQIEVVAQVDDEEKKLLFKPVLNSTLGNNATHSSEYEAAADWLKDTSAFKGRIVHLDFPGGETHNKTFQFSKKN